MKNRISHNVSKQKEQKHYTTNITNFTHFMDIINLVNKQRNKKLKHGRQSQKCNDTIQHENIEKHWYVTSISFYHDTYSSIKQILCN